MTNIGYQGVSLYFDLLFFFVPKTRIQRLRPIFFSLVSPKSIMMIGLTLAFSGPILSICLYIFPLTKMEFGSVTAYVF